MEEINISRKINNFLREIRKLKKIFTKIEFIIQYGSSTIKNYFFEDSDIDICIYIDDKNENLAKFRLEILTNIDDIFDIQIYQLLPIYV
ncbi:MAG: nucleotidyltransferase domain-containing protein, partial [Promethearchaeota archaeon]